MISPQQLAEADAYIRAKYPEYVSYVHGDTFQGSLTTAATAPANVGILATITIDGDSGTTQTVPQSQVWRFNDLYTLSTTDVGADGTVTFVKNRIKTLATTAPLSAQLTTNQTRPGLPQAFIFEPQSNMRLLVAPTVAVTTTATDNFYMDVTIYDASYGS